MCMPINYCNTFFTKYNDNFDIFSILMLIIYIMQKQFKKKCINSYCNFLFFIVHLFSRKMFLINNHP